MPSDSMIFVGVGLGLIGVSAYAAALLMLWTTKRMPAAQRPVGRGWLGQVTLPFSVGGGGGGGGGGRSRGSDTVDSPEKTAALAAYWRAKRPGVRQLIVSQGELNLQARLALSGALEQRLAQGAAFMLTATAFAAGLAFNDKAPELARIAALASTLCFAAGAAFCAAGIGTRSIGLPGVTPTFWTTAELETFELEDAEYWRLGHVMDSIERARAAAERRGGLLNFGLEWGVAGAVFTVFSTAAAFLS